MQSLNQIAERIAYGMNEPLNTMLNRNIKFSIRQWRATLIRQDIQTNGLSEEYLQRIEISLIDVDKADSCNFNLDRCKIKRSSVQIPQFIRWKNDVTFKFFGTIDGKPFTETAYEEVPYTCYNRFTSNVNRFCLVNQYAYIFNTPKHLKKAFLQHIFVDPYEANNLCSGCYDDNSPFPCPADMVQRIITGLVTGDFKMSNPVSEEVQIQETN